MVKDAIMIWGMLDILTIDIVWPIFCFLVVWGIPACIVILFVKRHLHRIERELQRWIWLKKVKIDNGKVWDNKIIVEYQPPKWLNPTEVWFLYDWKVWKADIICMIYKWVSMWFVSLNYKWWKVVVKKLSNIKTWIPRYEEVFRETVFRKWNIVEIPNDRMYWELLAVKDSLLRYCQRKGRIKWSSLHFSLEELFRRSSPWVNDSNKISYIPIWRLMWLCIWLTMVISWFILAAYAGRISVLLAAISPIISVVWLFIGYHFLISLNETANKKAFTYTEKWKEVVAKIYWYKQFLESCEEKQLKKLMEEDPMYLDKILPYAVALGLENIISSKIPENLVLDDEKTADIFLLEKVL